MERILFHLGPMPIYTFGVSIAMGVLAAFWLTGRETKRSNMDANTIDTLFIILLLAGIVGARIFYVLFYNPVFYWQHLFDIIRINEGGLSIHGGIIGAAVAGFWYTRRFKIPFWPVADLLAPVALLAQGIARVGCDVYGRVMSKAWPWGINLQGQIVHPVQIYETILDLGLFIYLWGKRDRQKYSGQIFVYYLSGYAGIRFILEFFRTNPVILYNITPAHLTSVLFILLAVGMSLWLSRGELLPETSQKMNRFWVSTKVWGIVVALAAICIAIFYISNG
ncbi:MAG: prolipoprotein diacylglyceryl transferase [Syntrophomonas sp.]